jgi:hypothetical protein
MAEFKNSELVGVVGIDSLIASKEVAILGIALVFDLLKY